MTYAGQHVAGHYRRNTEKFGQTEGDKYGLLNSIIINICIMITVHSSFEYNLVYTRKQTLTQKFVFY